MWDFARLKISARKARNIGHSVDVNSKKLTPSIAYPYLLNLLIAREPNQKEIIAAKIAAEPSS